MHCFLYWWSTPLGFWPYSTFLYFCWLFQASSSICLFYGSALNICPLAIAVALGFGPLAFEPSSQTVRAYDNTCREVLVKLTLDLQICPVTFSTLFQVLRIPTSFNLLLGQPWIHRAGAIPSSLHQKVKFIHEGRVITIQSIRDSYSTSEPVLEISWSLKFSSFIASKHNL